MTLLAAFKTPCCHRYTGQLMTFLVGTFTNRQPQPLPKIEETHWVFPQYALVLRTQIYQGNPYLSNSYARSGCGRVTLEADAHRDLPFDHLVQDTATRTFFEP